MQIFRFTVKVVFDVSRSNIKTLKITVRMVKRRTVGDELRFEVYQFVVRYNFLTDVRDNHNPYIIKKTLICQGNKRKKQKTISKLRIF